MVQIIGHEPNPGAPKRAVYNSLPVANNFQPLYHATNIPAGQWKGKHLNPNLAPVEVVHGTEVVDLNTDSTPYLFAGLNPALISALVLKTPEVFAASTTQTGEKTISNLFVNDLDTYLKTVAHVGRLITIPVQEVLKAGFKSVLNIDGSPTDKYISPNAVPLSRCRIQTITLEDAVSDGLQIYYMKRGHNSQSWLDLSKDLGLSPNDPRFIQECIKAGIMSQYQWRHQ